MSAAYVTDGVAKMAPVKYSSIVFTYLVDIFYFGYKFTTNDIIATIIILIAIISPSFLEH